MTEEIENLDAAGSYSTPELTSLGSVEQLTAGNQTYMYDNGATNPTYLNANGEEHEPHKGHEPHKPKK